MAFMHRSILTVLAAAAAVTLCSSAWAVSAADTAAPAAAAPPPVPSSDFGPWGLDLTARDPGVRPGADFYKFANGHWIATNVIPPDRSSWNGFTTLVVDAEKKVQDIIQNLPPDAPKDSLQRKIGDFYRAYLDTAQINHDGVDPARPVLREIDAVKTHEQVATLLGRPDLQVDSPVNFGIRLDEKNPDRYIVAIGQGGLGMPQREYYLSQDPQFARIRSQYLAHIERMLTLIGDQSAAADAQAVLDTETKIAQQHWPIEKQRERELTYNLRTRDALRAAAPNFPWQSLLGAAGVAGEKDYVVLEVDAVEKLASQFRQIPVAAWKPYLKYHYLVSKAPVLPKAFDDERFGFYGKTLNGQPQQRDRWKRAVQATNGALGEAVGQLYVERYFPASAKAQMLDLVENLRAAYKQRIQAASWMTPETRQAALKKLETFRPKIAYPDKWRDYSDFTVKTADAFGNHTRAAVFEWQRELKRLHLPTDRDEWELPPQTVNAYYNPTFNEIVFPAAILQPPFFDPKADAAVNYGGIGGVIGHEMSHGFDDQGAKSDERGVLRSWWKPEDEAAFKALGDKLAHQYDQFAALPGLNINGRLTLGENLGDLNGMTVAYAAYHLSLKDKPAPVLDGLSGDQRFFLSWAQVWRSLDRDESLRTQVMSDPHSPPRYRVLGVVRNMDAWYDAFQIAPTDPLYLAPEQRVRVW
jgi:putative endopeptidase